jgi:mannose-1-phosphate guanylyltransferase/mannose-6-phosphate isomerase
MSNAPKITPVILSGGAGTRLWPASRSGRPKQLIALVGQYTLLQATALRIVEHETFNRPVIVTSNELVPAVADQLSDIGVEASTFVLEPAPRGTAPATAIAALLLADEDAEAVFALLPSDHTIANENAFVTAMTAGAVAARGDALVAFGIPPTAPETGYGYIRRGKPLSVIDGCYHLERFVEKPDWATAERYLAAGDYFWNSGMLVLSARSYLRELRRLEPIMLGACETAYGNAVRKGKFIHIDGEAFSDCPSQSIDRAVMERTEAAAVIPVDLGWNDVGAWAAVWEIGEKDDSENVVFGEADLTNVRESLIYNECSTSLVIDDIVGLVVASTSIAVFVAERVRSAEIGVLVPHLSGDLSNLPISDAAVHMAEGRQIVKIGCPAVEVVISVGSVRIVGSEALPDVRSRPTKT